MNQYRRIIMFVLEILTAKKAAMPVEVRLADFILDEVNTAVAIAKGHSPQATPLSTVLDTVLDNDYQTSLELGVDGRKIIVIKRLRFLTGCSLREAKDAVERKWTPSSDEALRQLREKLTGQPSPPTDCF